MFQAAFMISDLLYFFMVLSSCALFGVLCPCDYIISQSLYIVNTILKIYQSNPLHTIRYLRIQTQSGIIDSQALCPWRMLWGQAEVPLFAYPRRGATRRGLSFFGDSNSEPFS